MYKSLSFHGILAVLRISAHLSLPQTRPALLKHGHVSVEPEETHSIPNSLCPQWDF